MRKTEQVKPIAYFPCEKIGTYLPTKNDFSEEFSNQILDYLGSTTKEPLFRLIVNELLSNNLINQYGTILI